MAKIFYDHLIVIEELIVELDSLDAENRQRILSLVDETLHHHVLDTILTHLPKVHHEIFLERYYKDPSDPDLLTFLKQKSTVDIEKLIAEKAKKVKKDIHATISKSKHKLSRE